MAQNIFSVDSELEGSEIGVLYAMGTGNSGALYSPGKVTVGQYGLVNTNVPALTGVVDRESAHRVLRAAGVTRYIHVHGSEGVGAKKTIHNLE